MILLELLLKKFLKKTDKMKLRLTEAFVLGVKWKRNGMMKHK